MLILGGLQIVIKTKCSRNVGPLDQMREQRTLLWLLTAIVMCPYLVRMEVLGIAPPNFVAYVSWH